MRKIASKVLAALALVVLAASARSAQAEVKPVVVVTFSGYDALRGDLDFIGQISDNPELGTSLDGMVALLTQLQGLVGLDKTKPWGVAISTDGNDLQNLAFLPVTDLKRLLGVLAGLVGPPEDLEEAVVRISVNNQPVYIKHERGWAFLAMSKEELAELPKDPMAIFGTLTKDYDLAARLNVQNVPEQYRDRAITEIRRGMEQGLERNDDETDAQYKTRVDLMEGQVDRLVQMLKDLNEVTLGWSIDGKGRRALLDLSITAVPGSKMAAQTAEAVPVPSKFAGFLGTDSLFNAHCATKEAADDITNAVTMIGSLRTTMAAEIDNSDDLEDQKEKDAVKQLANQVLDVVEATLKAGVIDGGMVVTPAAPFTVAAGLGIVGGDKLEAAFRQAVEFGKDKDGAPAIQLDADKHQGVTLHTIKGDWPADDDASLDDQEMMKKMLGDTFQLTAGFGKDRVYLALGADGADAIKRVIDSSTSPSKSTNPLQMNLSMSHVMDFAAENDPDNIILGICADALDKGKDKIHLTSSNIPNGALVRIEIEEGVLRVLGVGARAVQPNAGR